MMACKNVVRDFTVRVAKTKKMTKRMHLEDQQKEFGMTKHFCSPIAMTLTQKGRVTTAKKRQRPHRKFMAGQRERISKR